MGKLIWDGFNNNKVVVMRCVWINWKNEKARWALQFRGHLVETKHTRKKTQEFATALNKVLLKKPA